MAGLAGGLILRCRIVRGRIVRGRIVGGLIVGGLLLTSAVASADVRGDSRSQVEFGIVAAQKELWKEALYRWKRAVDIDPTYAAAFNNLAIAYEHEGQFEEARKAYERAIEIEPNNALIKQNYDLFREINDRTNRSGDR
jgi:Flp pilus assembly protein TadD